jgi:hypothetical protein
VCSDAFLHAVCISVQVFCVMNVLLVTKQLQGTDELKAHRVRITPVLSMPIPSRTDYSACDKNWLTWRDEKIHLQPTFLSTDG